MARLVRSVPSLGAAVLSAVVLAGPVRGQGFDLRSLFNAPGPSPGASSAPADSSAAPEWSGESGASGHPLMSAQAIRAAAANFHGCLEALRPLAQRRGVSGAVFDAQGGDLTPDLR